MTMVFVGIPTTKDELQQIQKLLIISDRVWIYRNVKELWENSHSSLFWFQIDLLSITTASLFSKESSLTLSSRGLD